MIKWTAPEFEYFKKTEWWHWALMVIAVILGLVALWQRNFLFLIFIVIAALVVSLLAREKPRDINFELEKRGLLINKKLYEYRTFDSFALRQAQDELGALQFKNKERWRPYLTIPITTDQQEPIRSYLLAFLPEVEYNESAIDALSRLLRF